MTRPPPVCAEPLVSERKFIAPADRAAFAAAVLAQVCFPEPDHPQGTVCSIYFDRPGTPCYHEKIDGDFIKAKIRLRWYQEDAGGDPVPAWVEVKRRFGGGRLKSRLALALPRDLLVRASWDDEQLRAVVGRSAAQLTGEATGSLLPLIQLTYERTRSLCPFTGARVNLDTGIRAERFNQSVLPHLEPSTLAVAVLEVKMAGAATEVPWLGRLAQAGFRGSSFSKFGALITNLI